MDKGITEILLYCNHSTASLSCKGEKKPEVCLLALISHMLKIMYIYQQLTKIDNLVYVSEYRQQNVETT